MIFGGKHAPVLVYNGSASAPIGWYRVLPAFPMHDGDLVLVPLPEPFATLAAERGYVPLSVPLVKRVAASAGAAVCASGGEVTIDGKLAADRLAADREGKELPAWSGCRRLSAGEIFLLMPDVPDSFDGRYFGPVAADAVIGRLEPLWLP
jgi:conjugative transfer signal peptidase TraF